MSEGHEDRPASADGGAPAGGSGGTVFEPDRIGAGSGPLLRPEHEVRPLRVLRAEQIMGRHIVTIDGGATVADAVRRMRAERVSSLITERRGPEDAWGIITRADVIRKVIMPGLDPGVVRVYEAMTKPLITVSPGLALKFCLQLMDMSGVRRAAVFDGTSLIGLLTHNDIFAALKV